MSPSNRATNALRGNVKKRGRYRKRRSIFSGDSIVVLQNPLQVAEDTQESTGLLISMPSPNEDIELPDLDFQAPPMPIAIGSNGDENDSDFEHDENGQDESNKSDSMGGVALDDDTQWDEALGVLAETNLVQNAIPVLDSSTSIDNYGDSINRNEVFDSRMIRRILSGKTIEALTWLMGSKGVTYVMYRRLSKSFNYYMKLFNKPKYPSYGTLLKRSAILLGSSFIPKLQVRAEVNTSRAGVSSRLVREMHFHGTANEVFTLIMPSEWARKDLLQYKFLLEPIIHRYRIPNCAYFDHAVVASPEKRIYINYCMYELFTSNLLYTYGHHIWLGEVVRMEVCDNTGQLKQLVPVRNSHYAHSLPNGAHTEVHVRIGQTQFARAENTAREIMPCDAVTKLEQPDGNEWYDAVLVHRFSPDPGVTSTFLSIKYPNESYSQFRWSKLLLSSARELQPLDTIEQAVPAFGKLANGQRYSIFRCLLYTDDFRPYSFKQSGCGGCYMLPLSIPSWNRQSTNSIRILSLTPPGISTNADIDAMIEDITKCASIGVPAEISDGSTINLFLDVVGYIGDYPAMVHLLDVTGVNGLAPCNFCTFLRGNISQENDNDFSTVEASRYAFSTAIHSGNLSFRRTRQRMETFRENASEEELRNIGLRPMSEEEVRLLPLHRLSFELEKVRHLVPHTNEGKPVVPCFFDPYLSCVVAPDHLLFGIGEDIAKATLRLLKPEERMEVNALSLQALNEVGFAQEGSYLNSAGELNSMSFSSFFVLMLVFPWAVCVTRKLAYSSTLFSETDLSSFSLLSAVIHALYSFQDLYMSFTRLPREPVDGAEAVNNFDGAKWHQYLSIVQRKATNYVNVINGLCMRSAIMRKFVDKPNIHRLLELCYHSLPRFGHVTLFEELVLEGGHQDLKKAISRSNNHSPHTQAMARFIADEWKRRLGDIVHEISDVQNMTETDCKKLMRAAFGTAKPLEDGVVSVEDIRKSFPPFLLEDLQEYSGSPDVCKLRRWVWMGYSIASLNGADRTVESFLRVLLTETETRRMFVRYQRAVLVAIDKDDNDNDPCHFSKRYGSRNSIQSGDFLQILLQDAPDTTSTNSAVTLLRPSRTCGIRTFWQVMGTYGVRGKTATYAHIRLMKQTSEEACFERVFKADTNSSRRFVVRLQETIRKVLALHDCMAEMKESCHYDGNSRVFCHDVDEESSWCLRGTMEGFPPRLR